MNRPAVIDPNADIRIEVFVGAPLYSMVQAWESAPPTSDIDPELLAHASDVLEAVGWLTHHPGIDRLRDAIAAQDGHALTALIGLWVWLQEVFGPVVIVRCKKWRDEENWAALRQEAQFAVRLATILKQEGWCAEALILLANAYQGFGDIRQVIDTCQAAIAAAHVVGNEQDLAIANNYLANALRDVGRFDEALDHYDEALRHEATPAGRQAILNNRAHTLEEMGELRWAARTFEQSVNDLEQRRVGGTELAIALDRAAIPMAALGEPAKALAMLERARKLRAPADLSERIANALSRSEVCLTLGKQRAAAQAFAEAHDCAFKHAQQLFDLEHYRLGFLRARKSQLPPDDEAYQLWAGGVLAKDANQWGSALKLLQQAVQRARDAGDHALALRISANAAAALGDAGQVEQAFGIATEVVQEAAERGLALPQMMALGTIESISAIGAELGNDLSPIELLARSVTLQKIHRSVVSEAGLSPEEMQRETYETGSLASELAKQAQTYHADDLAIHYYRQAVESARAAPESFQLANRLAGLRDVLARSGHVQEADEIADELVALLDKGTLPDRGQLVAHRTLGFHYAERDRMRAIKHLQQACSILETLRQRVAPGPERAAVARQFQGLYRYLAELLRKAGDDTRAFEALQGEKGRRLIAGRAALDGENAQIVDSPSKATEVVAQLGQLGGQHPTVLIDLAVDDGLTAYLVGIGTVRAIHVDGDPARLEAPEWGDILEREASLVSLCLRQKTLSELAEAITAALPSKCRVLLAPDDFLNNLPLHIVPVQGHPWCEHLAIGYLPASGVLRFAPKRRQPMGRSFVAGDSRGDLPNARAESIAVAAELHTTAYLGQECTRAALVNTLQTGELDVVHLALHGQGDGRRGGRAGVLLADGAGGTEWMGFSELTALPWRAELVVFSGCSTGVAGPLQGHELASVARAVLERGAGAVIACLWPVGDQIARVFMTAFYKELVLRRVTGPVDLREILAIARAALRAWLPVTPPAGERRRDGRSQLPRPPGEATSSQTDPAVTDALAWAPFILLGDPILGD